MAQEGVEYPWQKTPPGFQPSANQNYWFWINKRDMQSKSLYSFLLMIFSLTETGGKGGAPIITIPAG